MAQFSVKIMRLTGSLLGENQHCQQIKRLGLWGLHDFYTFLGLLYTFEQYLRFWREVARVGKPSIRHPEAVAPWAIRMRALGDVVLVPTPVMWLQLLLHLCVITGRNPFPFGAPLEIAVLPLAMSTSADVMAAQFNHTG